MRSASSARTTHLEPQGAYTELSALQQLRYLAEPIPHSANLAGMASSSGRHKSRALSRGMEFEEVRQYQPGDDVRNIDWRVTARTQITHTKRYRDEKEKPIITIVDQRRSMFFGSQACFKSVYACSLAALINWSTLERGDKAGGMVIGTRGIHETRPVQSHKGVNRWLQMLTEANQQLNTENLDPEPSFEDALAQLLRIAHKGSEIMLISDCYDLNANCEALLFQLARHNRVSLFWLMDTLETQFPLINDVLVSNGLDKTLVNINQRAQQQHHDLFVQKQEFITGFCQRSRVLLTEVDTTIPLTELISRAIRYR